MRNTTRPMVAVSAIAVLLGSWLWEGSARALIPPLSVKELDERASLIVEGTVTKVGRAGKLTHDHCYGWQPMRAVLEVERQTKGKPARRVEIRYSTRVESNKGCVGGRTSYSLSKGTRYRLHLRCAAQTAAERKERKPPRCSMINWAGVKSLPKASKQPKRR